MNEEEKQAIERLERGTTDSYVIIKKDVRILLNLLEKQQAEIEKLRKQKIEYQPSITITNSELLKGK